MSFTHNTKYTLYKLQYTCNQIKQLVLSQFTAYFLYSKANFALKHNITLSPVSDLLICLKKYTLLLAFRWFTLIFLISGIR